MFLVKCKCKSVFTLGEDAIKNFDLLECPNCKSNIDFNIFTSIESHRDLTSQVESISVIPDDAKITVTFDT